MAEMTSAPAPAKQGIDIDQLRAFANALFTGDLSFRFPVPKGMSWQAEEVAVGLNRHLERMQELLSEVSRVCDEVGTKGTLGPQAGHTFGPGPWRQMIDSVNLMATHLTMQLRDMNRTAKLIAAGDCTRPVTCPCEGETLELKNALNAINDRLRGQQPPA